MSYIGNRPLTQAEKKTQQHTVTEGQTDFNVSGGYTVGLIDVFLNGVLLLDGIDYIATNGINIDLAIEAKEGDTLVTIAWGSFIAANVVQPNDPRLATAWAVFDGTLAGTNAPLAGLNVASVTRTEVGTYAVNFDVAMDNVNYALTIEPRNFGRSLWALPTVNGFDIRTTNTAFTATDVDYCAITVFGGKD